MRAIVAIVAGIVAAIAAQVAIDLLTNWIYPAAVTDMWDRQQMSDAFAARPAAALWLNVLSYFLGGFVGGLVAKLISGKSWAAWVPPALLAFFALVIAFNFPLPVWTWFATLAAPLIGGLIANHLARGRIAGPTEGQ